MILFCPKEADLNWLNFKNNLFGKSLKLKFKISARYLSLLTVLNALLKCF